MLRMFLGKQEKTLSILLASYWSHNQSVITKLTRKDKKIEKKNLSYRYYFLNIVKP